MATDELKFVPAWHQFGDADVPALAVVYGIVAMATVWMFESIVSLVLFNNKDDNISLSQVAAMVCHSGSSWRDLIKWQLSKRKLDANVRAYLAVLLRLLITVIDIVIIILAIPSTTIVTEGDVGISQLNLQQTGSQLLSGKYPAAVPNPCIWDRLKFSEFSPSAAKLVCTNAMDDTNLQTPPNSSMGFMMKYDTNLQRLEFRTTPDNRPFYLTHNLFLPANDARGAPITYNLPLPDDIEAQATNIIVANTNCTANGTRFDCPQSDAGLRTEILTVIMENVYTKQVKSGVPTRKVLANRKYEVDEEFAELGTVNRPLLCIYPALILFGFLGIVYVGTKIVSGRAESVEVKLLNLAVEAVGEKITGNPLVVKSKTLLLFHGSDDNDDSNSGGGGQYLSKSDIEIGEGE